MGGPTFGVLIGGIPSFLGILVAPDFLEAPKTLSFEPQDPFPNLEPQDPSSVLVQSTVCC